MKKLTILLVLSMSSLIILAQTTVINVNNMEGISNVPTKAPMTINYSSSDLYNGVITTGRMEITPIPTGDLIVKQTTSTTTTNTNLYKKGGMIGNGITTSSNGLMILAPGTRESANGALIFRK